MGKGVGGCEEGVRRVWVRRSVRGWVRRSVKGGG